VLTPFKLLPFFSVRVRFGVMLVDRDLVEVLAGVRVIREHVGWSHFPINRSEGSSGMEGRDGLRACGKFCWDGSMCVFLL